MSTIINGTSSAITFPDSSVQNTAFTTGSVTQATIGTNVAGTGPAFSAYRTGGNQSVTTDTWTKVQLNAENFDTANAFDSTTNYRFTPQVAGYYLISGCISAGSSSYSAAIQCGIYKNGSIYRVGVMAYSSEIINFGGPTTSAVIYCNGSTDYIELYGYVSASTGPQFTGSNNSATYMSGALIRAS